MLKKSSEGFSGGGLKTMEGGEELITGRPLLFANVRVLNAFQPFRPSSAS